MPNKEHSWKVHWKASGVCFWQEGPKRDLLLWFKVNNKYFFNNSQSLVISRKANITSIVMNRPQIGQHILMTNPKLWFLSTAAFGPLPPTTANQSLRKLHPIQLRRTTRVKGLCFAQTTCIRDAPGKIETRKHKNFFIKKWETSKLWWSGYAKKKLTILFFGKKNNFLPGIIRAELWRSYQNGPKPRIRFLPGVTWEI